MGIPSYFSYIVRNHKNILKKMMNIKINNLYLDSNSIIYDCLRKTSDINQLFLNICTQIDTYISTLKPNNTIFIAFDGVAPVAKLDQQRNRRYKSYLEKELRKAIGEPIGWDTTMITPGTKFMKDLGNYVEKYFMNREKHYKVEKIIISTSNEVGEGEHKLFQYIRDRPHWGETTVIYGLDADLIMLCLNHLSMTKNIYLYRETPEFVKSIHAELEPNETYLLDIPLLADALTREMKTNSLYDYIFLCFFLGNDFMPHFPSVNIRTKGIDIMLSAYKTTLTKTETLTDNGRKINWKNVRKLIMYLAENEWKNLMAEYKIREKWERRKIDDDKMNKYLHIPTKNREIEKYIDPTINGWELRYYKTLFGFDITETKKQQICVNFLEGLEWTMRYYIEGCVDWNWCYHYDYPPLWKDLIKFVPYFDTIMIEPNDHTPVSKMVQLAYVLPITSRYLLPDEISDKLSKEEAYGCLWAFCKYFWEAHIQLPQIDIQELSNLINN